MGNSATAHATTRDTSMAQPLTVRGFDGPQAITIQLLWLQREIRGITRFTLEELEKALIPLVPMLEGYGPRTLAMRTIQHLKELDAAYWCGTRVCLREKFTQIKSEVVDRLVTAEQQEQIRNLYRHN
jgi:hypothetical protein